MTTRAPEYFTLRIRDLSTGEDLADVIENTGGSGAWSPDGKSFFYTLQDENHRPSRSSTTSWGSRNRKTGWSTRRDPGYFMGVGGSLLDDFIYLDIHDHETSEYRILSTRDLTAEPMLVAERVEGIEYSLTEGGDVFYILTNDGDAKDFKIVEAVSAPGKENWRKWSPMCRAA